MLLTVPLSEAQVWLGLGFAWSVVWAQRLTAESEARAPTCSADPVGIPRVLGDLGPLLGRGVVAAPTGPGTSLPWATLLPQSIWRILSNPSFTITLTPHSHTQPKATQRTLQAAPCCLPSWKHTFPPLRGSPRPHLLVFPRKKLKMFEN